VDERVMEALCSLPREACKQVLDEVLTSNIAGAQHKQRWIMGCIKRYLAKQGTGEQFLTLEEERAGIVEKAKQERGRGGGAGRGGGRGGDRGQAAQGRGKRPSPCAAPSLSAAGSGWRDCVAAPSSRTT
jgi:hypothetical protein